MKKVIVACAAVLALGMISCSDTKMCYKLTVKVQEREVATYYQYGTSADIDAYIASIRKAQEAVFGEGVVEINRSKLSNMKSEEDCTGAQLNVD